MICFSLDLADNESAKFAPWDHCLTRRGGRGGATGKPGSHRLCQDVRRCNSR